MNGFHPFAMWLSTMVWIYVFTAGSLEINLRNKKWERKERIRMQKKVLIAFIAFPIFAETFFCFLHLFY